MSDVTRDRRPQSVMEQVRGTLPEVDCECGHRAVRAGDYYSTPTRKRGTKGIWGMCIACYQEIFRERQRAGRSNPSVPVSLKTAGHAYDIEKTARDPELEAALGVLRDYKAQRSGRQGYVYLISDGTAYKVGYSVNPNKRVAELQTGNPRKLSLLAFVPGTEADEKALHAKYIADNLLQEWFTASPELRAEFKTKEN